MNDEYLEYIESTAEAIKYIVLKIANIKIEYRITKDNCIEFSTVLKISITEETAIRKEIKNSEFSNWMLFFIKADEYKYNKNVYSLMNFMLPEDAIKYNRSQGLKSLLSNESN